VYLRSRRRENDGAATRYAKAQRFEKYKVGYSGSTTYSSSSRRAHLTSRQVEGRETACGL
jgi:hypothetical protein